MKDKKLQVFVSSTYTDLKEERQAAVEAILAAGHIPAGMELFTAGDESQMTVIKRWIDESDVYLLLLGGRYGSVEEKSGKSYTHLEYEYAISKNKPWFAVVIKDEALDAKIRVLNRAAIEQEYPKELKEFKESIIKNTVVKFWNDTKDIKLAIYETLSDFGYNKELIGWIRGDNSINTGLVTEEIARLTKENSELREKINAFNTTSNILYAGITYHQLESLLKEEIINGSEKNLLQLLLQNGEKFSIGVNAQRDTVDVINKLMKYKLLVKTSFSNTFVYTFTEDGHNFYLKALILSKEAPLS